MKKSLVLLGAAGLLLFTLSFSAMANPPLRNNEQVTQGLVTVGVALEIDRNCDHISARKLRGIAFLSNLKQIARGQGYSNAEIAAFVNDKAQKDVLKLRAKEVLVTKGATTTESFCTVGQEEIANDTPVGHLLYAH